MSKMFSRPHMAKHSGDWAWGASFQPVFKSVQHSHPKCSRWILSFSPAPAFITMQDFLDLVKNLPAFQRSVESVQAHTTDDEGAKPVQERKKTWNPPVLRVCVIYQQKVIELHTLCIAPLSTDTEAHWCSSCIHCNSSWDCHQSRLISARNYSL